MGLITILTDFGQSDSYVGAMKGVIYGIHPRATIVDLTHGIPPQDIAGGRFQLGMAAPYFPVGTVHIAVVDPGVGTDRRAVAFATDRALFVGPDNGLMILDEVIRSAVRLDNPKFWRTASPTASSTFHGRDIFAAIGAHLARGVPLEAVGSAIDPATLVRLHLQADCIQAIDHFGNCITNRCGTQLGAQVQIGHHVFRSVRTYGEASPGEAIALVGSHGWIEIAVVGGNAQVELGLQIGDQLAMPRTIG